MAKVGRPTKYKESDSVRRINLIINIALLDMYINMIDDLIEDEKRKTHKIQA